MNHPDMIQFSIIWYLVGLLSIPTMAMLVKIESMKPLSKKDITKCALLAVAGPFWFLYVLIPTIAMALED